MESTLDEQIDALATDAKKRNLAICEEGARNIGVTSPHMLAGLLEMCRKQGDTDMAKTRPLIKQALAIKGLVTVRSPIAAKLSVWTPRPDVRLCFVGLVNHEQPVITVEQSKYKFADGSTIRKQWPLVGVMVKVTVGRELPPFERLMVNTRHDTVGTVAMMCRHYGLPLYTPSGDDDSIAVVDTTALETCIRTLVSDKTEITSVPLGDPSTDLLRQLYFRNYRNPLMQNVGINADGTLVLKAEYPNCTC